MVTVFGWLIAASWGTLVVYWCIAGAAAVRKISARWIWWREIALRLGFFAALMVLLQIEAATGVLPTPTLDLLNTNSLTGLAGFLLVVLGVGLAIAARVRLGSGWVASASSQDSLELITDGPFALVRHPLYGGLLLAILGSAISQSVLWVVPLILYGPAFVLSARREEALMRERFPQRYRDYMKRTKRFVPFLW
ncbi:MAG: isoprenylcysteine carboxylmethyltransferase family protein [Proteobacteria bacterium]|nr:isoprenylcysteine carboxylmethyltransferase family protein [Pseudomonadota bacterium]